MTNKEIAESIVAEVAHERSGYSGFVRGVAEVLDHRDEQLQESLSLLKQLIRVSATFCNDSGHGALVSSTKKFINKTK